MTEFDIDRFVEAQDKTYEGYAQALQEMQDGQKQSHWIWYIFPQRRGLGRSENSWFYGIEDIDEAKEYLAHPILGPRLREITEAVLSHAGDLSAEELMSSWIDAKKLESCMKLFDKISPNDIFREVLDAYF